MRYGRTSKGRDDEGFTERCCTGVVVVILAVGVLIPNLNSYDGCACSPTSEKDIVQTAMDSMMAENNVAEVEASPEHPINDWTSYPTVPGLGLVPLADRYLREDTTDYFYCWDTSGLIAEKEFGTDPC